MNRNESLRRLSARTGPFDIAIIGGGASGFGVALEALARGLSVVLLEKSDFGKGTSSRSTKLLHGGVRYLAQGQIRLVYEALGERGLLLKAAPHLSSVVRFVIPVYSNYERFKYTAGLKVYDLMSGRLRIGRSRFVTREDTLRRLPNVKEEGLLGGVIYHDGQFDDARLLISIARTCFNMGACLLNHVRVKSLVKNAKGRITGLTAKDELSNEKYEIKARMVVNATGVFADKILRMDTPGAPRSIKASQGIHLVLDQEFLGGQDALMIPDTSDGRVLFILPWKNKLIVGTTDTLRDKPSLDPDALEEEIDFVLDNAAQFLKRKPTRADVRSVFAGLRPLAMPKEGSTKTKEVSRSHKVIISNSGLVSIVGGKWTTFRKMGEDTVLAFSRISGTALPPRRFFPTAFHGATPHTDDPLNAYGSDAPAVKALQGESAEWAQKLHPDHLYTAAEVVWAIRYEMAMTIEDVLSRRIRLLLLDARAAIEAAPTVATILAKELDKDAQWVQTELEDFYKIARKYLIQKP
ncbi:MAG: glycerol-3-phosphate dehydrogenase/oxidase [Cryomorphaceae bacterium]|nr:MAG: glycerol-3-phosphate dehydrogenase/oxidase [Cryomorphaceae bacterium]